MLLSTIVIVSSEPALAQTSDTVRSDQQSSQLKPAVVGRPVELRCGESARAWNFRFGATQPPGDAECARQMSKSWFDGGEKLTVPLSERFSVQGSFQFVDMPSHAASGQMWQSRAELAYRAPGGLQVTAAIVGRRGYEAPLFVTEGIGGDRLPFTATVPMLDTGRPVIWDTVLRVEQPLGSVGSIRASLVGEVFNFVRVNRNTERKPINETLTSRTVRLGIKFKF